MGLSAFALVTRGGVIWSPEANIDVRFYEVLVGLLILAATVVAISSSSRLTSVAALGVVGYGVALIYTLFGAPDLAMTQFAIETLTVFLFVLVLYRLPRFARLTAGERARCSGGPVRRRPDDRPGAGDHGHADGITAVALFAENAVPLAAATSIM